MLSDLLLYVHSGAQTQPSLACKASALLTELAPQSMYSNFQRRTFPSAPVEEWYMQALPQWSWLPGLLMGSWYIIALEPMRKIAILIEELTKMIVKQPHSPVPWESHEVSQAPKCHVCSSWADLVPGFQKEKKNSSFSLTRIHEITKPVAPESDRQSAGVRGHHQQS